MKMVASRGYLQLNVLIGYELEEGGLVFLVFSNFFFGRGEVFILFAEEPHTDLTACRILNPLNECPVPYPTITRLPRTKSLLPCS
jgi:hypothetical protein